MYSQSGAASPSTVAALGTSRHAALSSDPFAKASGSSRTSTWTDLGSEILHVAFQLHFMQMNGFAPTLDRCIDCQRPIDQFPDAGVSFKVKQGGISCTACGPCKPGGIPISKGTVKHLDWVLNAPLPNLHRIRFSRRAVHESCRVLEAFIPCHLGQETKSLKLLKELTAPRSCLCLGH